MDKRKNVVKVTRGKVIQEKEGDIMSAIKPIQATPELTGQDAINLIKQVLKKPSQSAVNKNNRMLNVLNNIKK